MATYGNANLADFIWLFSIDLFHIFLNLSYVVSFLLNSIQNLLAYIIVNSILSSVKKDKLIVLAS